MKRNQQTVLSLLDAASNRGFAVALVAADDVVISFFAQFKDWDSKDYCFVDDRGNFKIGSGRWKGYDLVVHSGKLAVVTISSREDS